MIKYSYSNQGIQLKMQWGYTMVDVVHAKNGSIFTLA